VTRWNQRGLMFTIGKGSKEIQKMINIRDQWVFGGG